MNKKILIIMFVAIFLITSVGAISAAKDSIPVKIVWNDVDDQPDFVIVELIKDGKVVDTAKLTAGNSWKTVFKVTDDGKYDVKEKISDDYSYKVSGNAKGGFVIHNKMVENAVKDDSDDVLGASAEEPAADVTPADGNRSSDADDEVLSAEDGNGSSDAAGDAMAIAEDGILADGNGTNGTDSNSTDNSTDDSNSTDNSTDDSTDDTPTVGTTKDKSSKDKTKDEKTTKTKTKTTTTTTITTKIINQTKKPVNATIDHKNTGFPIVVLIIALFVAIFIPLSRKK